MTLNRVLIVEDTRDVGRYYQDTIRAAFPGVGISLVPSAEEALLEASRFSYDLLVSDIRLPGISGFDLVRKIRPRLPEIKIMIVTGLKVDALMEKQCRDLGVDLMLSKPVGVKEFLGSIEALTGEKSRLALGDLDGTAFPQPPLRLAQTAPLLLRPNDPPAAAQQPSKAGSGDPTSLRLLLADLRGSLNAQLVVLLDEQGAVTEQAGNWPTPELERRLVPEVLAARAGLDKLSTMLRPAGASSAHAIQGEAFDLAFAPVDRSIVLVFLRSSSGPLRLALAFEHLMTVQTKLARILEENRAKMPRPLAPATLAEFAPTLVLPESEPPLMLAAQVVTAPLSPDKLPAAPVEPPVPEDPAALASLSALLGQGDARKGTEDVDAFWDQAITTKKSSPGEGALTYEQARELGLLPKE
jgi:DNA-binding response OmpR family regulator